MSEKSEKDDKIRIELEVPKEDIQIGAISSESSDSDSDSDKKSEDDQEKSKKKEEGNESEPPESEEESGPKIAGYKASDIAKAPIDTPEPEDKDEPNPHQKTVIVFGCAIVLASLILWPLFSFWIFVAVAVAGAAVVAFGSLVRV